jgi:hypothetical protein
VYNDGTNKAYILCDTNPAKLFVVSGGNFTDYTLTNLSPTSMTSDDTYLYIGTSESPANIEIRLKSNCAYDSTIALTENQCYDIKTDDSGNIWGTFYTEDTDGIGKVFRLTPPLTVDYFDVNGIDKLYTLAFDAEGVLWVGSQSSPGQIAKCELETGNILTPTITILDTGENNVSNLRFEGRYGLAILDESASMLQFLVTDLEVVEWNVDGMATPDTGDVIPFNEVLYTCSGWAISIKDNNFYMFSTIFTETKGVNTDFRSKWQLGQFFKTNLIALFRTIVSIGTDLRIGLLNSSTYQTDFRYAVYESDDVEAKPFSDLIVKKDGSELVDVSYDTLRLNFSLGTTSSSAEFTLARRHDNLNETMDGIASIITAQNKITIFDGTRLLFTGYITKLNPNSTEDTVGVTAEDCRYKLSNRSMELEYGGKYDAETKKRTSISTKQALETVFAEVDDIITGYSTIDFGFVPEYTESYSDCCSLIDTLVRNSGTINWYVDENERIRFQKVANGKIKTLSLSSLTEHRHLYDVVVDNITLNKQMSNYLTAIEIKFGKYRKMQWVRSMVYDSGDPWTLVRLNYKDKPQFEVFAFQNFFGNWLSPWLKDTAYVGQSAQVASGELSGPGGIGLWGIRGYVKAQFLFEDVSLDIPVVTIGVGDIKKTYDYSSYGRQSIGWQYLEKPIDITVTVNVPLGRDYGGPASILTSLHIDSALYLSREEQFDYRAFAEDAAYFDLYQNNKLLTEATVDIILDAYEYYNLTLSDLINIDNTINPNVYHNANGFPLNIDRISINCQNKIVTLSLTNYGQTFYKRIGNYMDNYVPAQDQFSSLKYPQLNLSNAGGLELF